MLYILPISNVFMSLKVEVVLLLREKKIQQDQINSLSYHRRMKKGRGKREVNRQAYARLLKTHLDAQVNSVLEHINALVLSFCEQRQTTR